MKHQCESFDGSCSIRMVDSGFSRWSGSTLRMTTNPLRLAASGPGYPAGGQTRFMSRSEEHTSELQSIMRISYAVFCLKKQNHIAITQNTSVIATDLKRL